MRSLIQNAIDRLVPARSYEPVNTVEQARTDVVVVDDSPGIQNVVGRIVTKAGLSVAFAASLQQVDQLALRDSSSLLLLDLALERSDAFDVLKHLSDVGFAGRIVPMSGQDETVLEHVEAFGKQLKLDMQPSLRKPFRADQLRIIVAEYVAHRSKPVKIDFAAALKSESLSVWHQPRVDLRNYKISGFETVVRVHDSRDGLLLPERFMGQLSDQEMTDLAVHMIRRAVSTWTNLATKNLYLTPSLKLRAKDLADPAVIDVLKDIRPDDVRWRGLVVNIQESRNLNDLPEVRKALVRTRIHQVHLALEDVSAVSGIVAFPELKVSEISLGRRFVLGCARDAEKFSIIKEVVAFARKMQVKVVAEGIETIEDMSMLRSIDIFSGQGNLFSSAIPSGSLQALAMRGDPLWQDSAWR